MSLPLAVIRDENTIKVAIHRIAATMFEKLWMNPGSLGIKLPTMFWVQVDLGNMAPENPDIHSIVMTLVTTDPEVLNEARIDLSILLKKLKDGVDRRSGL